MDARTLSKLRQRVAKMEKTMDLIDGKKTRKPRVVKKKKYRVEDLPFTRGFGGKKILKDGTYGDIVVFFNKIYTKPKPDPAADLEYLKAVRQIMIATFGRFRQGDEIDYVEVDNSHLRRRKK